MSMKGWLYAILAMPLTFGMSLNLYAFYWFWKKVGKWVIKIFLFPVKVAIAILEIIWRIIATVFGGSAHAVEDFFIVGKENMKKHPNASFMAPSGFDNLQKSDEGDSKGRISGFLSHFSFIKKYKIRYIVIFIVAVAISPVPSILMNPMVLVPETLSFSGIIDVLGMTLPLSIPFLITFGISALEAKLTGNFSPIKDFVKGAGGASAGAGAAGAAAGAASTAKDAASKGLSGAADMSEKAMTTYDNLKTAKDVAEAGGEAAAEEGMLADVMGTIGLEGLIGGEAAAGGGGLAGGIVGSGGTLLVALVILAVIWVVTTLIAIAIAAVIASLMWGYIMTIVPIFAGPVMSALGLGEAYGQWFGQSVSNSFLPQFEGAFEEEKRMIAQMGAKIGCALEGPQCLRQWRMNNTVRPGSESRGETYELRIQNFGMGVDKIDTAYKNKEYSLPINFLVYNTRHGLKGIRARNVTYKIQIEDANNQDENAYCSTGWKSINSSVGDFLIPGLGASPKEELKKLNLANCQLLQPSMGVNRVVELNVRYNYSSQATLYVDAMSRKYRRQKGIKPSFKKSKTAKTPVQSYINVKSPVTYYTTESGRRKAVPFAARFGFQVPGFDVKYRVNPESIVIRDSTYTVNTSRCNGLERDPSGGPNNYDISDDARTRINLRQNKTWFTKNIAPAPLRCTMKIEKEDLPKISPKGTQMIFRIDANYTVTKNARMSSFNVVNTACTRENCPMLVTKEYAENHNSTEPGLHYKCNYATSVDSYGGCSVRSPKGDGDGDDTQINWRRVNLAKRKIDLNDDGSADKTKKVTIRQGDEVIKFEDFINDLSGSTPYSFIENNPEYPLNPKVPIGVNMDRLQKMRNRANGMIVYETHDRLGDIRFRSVNVRVCKGVSNGMQRYLDNFQERLNGYKENGNEARDVVEAYYAENHKIDCTDSLKQFIEDSTSCAIGESTDAAADAVSLVNPWDGGFLGGTGGGGGGKACKSAAELINSCSQGSTDRKKGVVVSRGSSVSCFGGQFSSS